MLLLKRRILFIQPSDSAGGAEFSLLAMIKHLHSRDYEVYLCVPPNGEGTLTRNARPYLQEILFLGLTSWQLSDERGVFLRVINRLYRFYKSGGGSLVPIFKLVTWLRDRKIDLVCSNTFISFDGAVAAKITGVQHVQYLREIIGYSEYAIAKFPLQKSPRLFKIAMSWLHSTVIVNSEFTKAHALEYFDSEALVKIYNPIDKSYFHLVKDDYKESTIVGLVANVTSRIKNHNLFVDIAKAYISTARINEDVVFNIYGALPDDNDEYYNMLMYNVHRYGLSNRVFFKGSKNSLDIYKELDVLIHTCSKEAFGRVYIEAMATGVPIIAVRSGASSELISDDFTGYLIDENDPESFADKLELLLNDKRVYSRIVAKAKLYSAKFKSDLICDEVIHEFNKALSR